jgi:hypothetical protein
MYVFRYQTGRQTSLQPMATSYSFLNPMEMLGIKSQILSSRRFTLNYVKVHSRSAAQTGCVEGLKEGSGRM